MSGRSSDQLFDGILEGARTKAKTIIERAMQDAAAVQTSYTKKIADAIAQEEKATEKRLEQIRRHEESTIKNLQRRYTVGRSERLRTLVLDSVTKKMEALRDDPSYRQILIAWIAEAAVGLDRGEGLVSCSFRETIDEEMLQEAREIVKTTTGKDVALQLSKTPLTGQGVEVSTLDGTVAYNNQVATRLLRKERDLKELMEGR
ncbi:V-type ATP synthase subunit E [Pleomorphochaeta sp. DL1XJH-081]|uniref:V-type ATP synthase subunit E n=1 Tax=Pleomorphochaeta sp. DL1XJH-081 TaxID=3409690 RepID=UPI003BB4C2E2